MHFFTTAAFAPILTALLIAVVSAQAPISEACITCILTTIFVTSPTCDAETLTSQVPDGGKLNAKQMACFCPLTTSKAWIQPCVNSAFGSCTASDIEPFYVAISAGKDVCDAGGIVPSFTSAPPAPSGTPEAGAGTGNGSGVGSGGNTNTPPTPATPKNGAGGLILGASSDKIFSGIFALAVASTAALLF